MGITSRRSEGRHAVAPLLPGPEGRQEEPMRIPKSLSPCMLALAMPRSWSRRAPRPGGGEDRAGRPGLRQRAVYDPRWPRGRGPERPLPTFSATKLNLPASVRLRLKSEPHIGGALSRYVVSFYAIITVCHAVAHSRHCYSSRKFF
jgi:hypothetical protein